MTLVPAGCSTAISGGACPLPVSPMVNVPSSRSLLASVSMAVLSPTLEGAKRTVKVVVPLGLVTGEEGCTVTVNIAASAPLTATLGVPLSSRLAVPVFLIVKTFTAELPVTTVPKPMLAAPVTRVVPAGCSTAISGLGKRVTVTV